MKKKWILLILVLSPFLCWSGCYVWQNMKIPGSPGEVEVTYTVPIIHEDVMQHGNWNMVFSASGHVESVRFIPREDGYVDLEVKTTKGWYYPSRPALPGPIDWEKGISVMFRYPKDMVLREETSSFITMRHNFLGLEGQAGYAGSPLLPGEVVSVRWSRNLEKKADQSGYYRANNVVVERRDRHGKPWSHGSGWGHNPSEIIEVLIFDHKVDAL